jgi:phenylalanyl-tRNA synthetase, beta subunit
MKASKKWLNEYVECLDIDVKDMEKALTMTGTKVEQIDEIGKYNNIVIGKILEITKHENAEKLVITKVDIGDEIIQIVTGAKNISVRRYYSSC